MLITNSRKLKSSLYILLTLIIIGCSQHHKQDERGVNKDQNKTPVSIIEDTVDLYSGEILTHIDAEELCEFSFESFVPLLNQKLSKEGLRLDVQTTNDYDSSFEIIINGRKVKLYTEKELSNGVFWESGPRNFFKIVNEILKEKHVSKKFYLLYGGNDLHAIFLTEDQFKEMSKMNENLKNEIPYLP
tara:strand:+ start:13920 stop:14480 length:561 start_codon:yes stop_codon:yes gene_type:complete